MTKGHGKGELAAMATAVAATDPELRSAMTPGARLEVHVRRSARTGLEGWAYVVPADRSHVRSSIETERVLMALSEQIEDVAGGRLTVERTYLHEVIHAPPSATLAAAALATGIGRGEARAVADLAALLRRLGRADLADAIAERIGADAEIERA